MKLSKEIKIGFFIVVVLTASFFLINYLRGEDIFNKEIELKSKYDDLHGLVASAPVHIKGYKAGEVTAVTYIAEEGNRNGAYGHLGVLVLLSGDIASAMVQNQHLYRGLL